MSGADGGGEGDLPGDPGPSGGQDRALLRPPSRLPGLLLSVLKTIGN